MLAGHARLSFATGAPAKFSCLPRIPQHGAPRQRGQPGPGRPLATARGKPGGAREKRLRTRTRRRANRRRYRRHGPAGPSAISAPQSSRLIYEPGRTWAAPSSTAEQPDPSKDRPGMGTRGRVTACLARALVRRRAAAAYVRCATTPRAARAAAGRAAAAAAAAHAHLRQQRPLVHPERA